MRTTKWTDKEITIFIKQLKQVIQWTSQLTNGFDVTSSNYAHVLRQTNPVVEGVALYRFEDDYVTWKLDNYDRKLYHKLLSMAIAARDAGDNIDISRLADMGRIICFQTGITTHDGVAIVESRCFVDESDVPPVDCWFYVKDNYYQSGTPVEQVLCCWIPKAFEWAMQQAMDVEIMGSYWWFDESDKDLYDRIIHISAQPNRLS